VQVEVRGACNAFCLPHRWEICWPRKVRTFSCKLC